MTVLKILTEHKLNQLISVKLLMIKISKKLRKFSNCMNNGRLILTYNVIKAN
jgi:hypothetical protein